MNLPLDLAAWESTAPVGREFGAVATPSKILVVDLEATCDENVPSFDMETIEIGAVWVAADGPVLDRFQAFARPVVNPLLTRFCSDLTGIHRADVDSAQPFPTVAEALRAFVARHRQPGAMWTSWGAWDCKQLERDSARHGITPPIDLPHVNAKRLFAKARRLGKEVGMAKAFELVGLQLEGAHHRALDDALNVARLLPWVLGPSDPSAAGLAALKGVIPKLARPVTTDEMHEAIGQRIKGEWIGGSPGFMDDGRGEQEQAERQRCDEIRKNDIG
ncbi:exonuclease domain-containing protein [Burkholderia ubonensis]|uniref:exonuclease domain-containing protein n=1 Tax=Burkholderia ubonensis TaxID=101571 RepID=UPI000B1D4E43